MMAAALSKVKAQVHIFSYYKESLCFSLKFAIASSPYRVLKFGYIERHTLRP